MNEPFFTVVIPTYNRAELLRDAIRSVLDQTFQEFEVIVVDDHSTDDTKEVIGSFEDGRISYILNDRGRGGAGTRNAGIFRAKGEWVAFLDDDDIWVPEKLSAVHKKILEPGSTAGLIYNGYASYDFVNNREMHPHTPKKEGWMQYDLLYRNYIGSFSAVAIRTDLLWTVGGLDEEFSALQDMELYTRIARLTNVAHIKDNLSYIRVANSDRISVSLRKKLESSLLFWEKNKALINKSPKLRHRAASRVLMFASQEGDLKAALKALPWTLSGLFFDLSNFINIFRSVAAFYWKK